MIATDPLSLVFLACAIFAGGFLLITTLLGGGHTGAHGLHIGGHAIHLPHLGSAHAGASHAAHIASPASPAPPHAISTGGAHPSTANTASSANGAHSAGSVAGGASASPLQAFSDLLLGSLNLYGLLMFLLVFGVLGYLLHNGASSLPLVFVLLIAAGVGATGAVGVNALLSRLFIATQAGELTADSSRYEGRLGTVSMAIRPDGIGEILCVGATGGRQSFGARSANGQAIPTGSEIVILSYENGIAQVQTWESFLAGLKSGDAPELQSLDDSPFTQKQLT
ncbi:MAG TPA: NfeD family protein [Ktedonobacterales bacterium]|nr:NfeD family protein [Ktedonobacterales bacterium]